MLTNIIPPQQISFQTIKEEIAKALQIPVARIKRCEHWQHRLWAHIEGIGGRLISYRSLPTYMYKAFLTVKNCKTLEQLWELGQLFKLETKGLPQYYYDEDENANEYLEKLRSAWAYKRDNLRIREQFEAPMKQHRQDGQKWLESFQEIIGNCDTTNALKYLYPLIRQQGKRFEDLPEIMEQVLNYYRQRWEEIELSHDPF